MQALLFISFKFFNQQLIIFRKVILLIRYFSILRNRMVLLLTHNLLLQLNPRRLQQNTSLRYLLNHLMHHRNGLHQSLNLPHLLNNRRTLLINLRHWLVSILSRLHILSIIYLFFNWMLPNRRGYEQVPLLLLVRILLQIEAVLLMKLVLERNLLLLGRRYVVRLRLTELDYLLWSRFEEEVGGRGGL